MILFFSLSLSNIELKCCRLLYCAGALPVTLFESHKIPEDLRFTHTYILADRKTTGGAVQKL